MIAENRMVPPEKQRPLVLRTTLTSPYGRKVRMSAQILGVSDRIAIVAADTRDEHDTLRQQNPLGKLPCLLRQGETPLFGSDVICDYLGYLARDNRLRPWTGVDRFEALTKLDLYNGIADAALLMVYEHRFRPAASVSPVWLDHLRGKILRGLCMVQDNLPDPDRSDACTIALSCALGYLDWRKPVDWRPDFPELCDWLACFASAEPAFEATRF